MARILAVDDDTDILNLVRNLLSMAGHQVLAAADGPAALAALGDRNAPDLAVLDVSMPPMDGVELAERLQQLPGLEHLPVIFLSAHVQQADVERGLAIGARYMTKPFTANALLHYVEMVMQGRVVSSDW